MSSQRNGLRYAHGRGLSIADARALRVTVRDGALWVHRPGREPQLIGSAASVTSAIWLDPAQTRRLLVRRDWVSWFAPLARWASRRRTGGALDGLEIWRGGSVVLYEGADVSLSFLVGPFAPWGGDAADQRESSGAVDLVRSMGTVLEAATEDQLPTRRAARAALVDAQPRQELYRRAATTLTVVAGVLAFLSWPYGGTVAGALFNVAALVTITPVLVLLASGRRRFERLVRVAPDPDGRTVYRPPARSIGSLDSHFQLGENDVVLVDAGGYERWLPGPAAGGVVSCVFGDGEVAWLDGRGSELLVLAVDDVAPDDESRERLTAACSSVGIGVSTDVLRPPRVPSYRLQHGTIEPGFWMSEWERGRIGMAVDVLLPLAGVLHLVGAAAAAYSFPPWGYLLVAGSAAWLGIRAWAGLRYRSWRREVVSKGAA